MFFSYRKMFYKDTELSCMYQKGQLVWTRSTEYSRIKLIRLTGPRDYDREYYVDDLLDARQYLLGNLEDSFHMIIGKEAEIVDIPNSTFYGCSSLSEITIPSSVKTIGALSFGNISDGAIFHISKPMDSIEGAPWGATNAHIRWNE